MKSLSFINFLGIVLPLGAFMLHAPPLHAEPARQSEKIPINSSDSTKVYTLNDLVEQALNRSELILSFNARVEEKRFAADQLLRFPNPEGSISAGQKEVSSESGSLFGLSLAQPFLFPGKRGLRFGIADSDMELAKIYKSKAEIFLIYDVLRIAFQHTVNHQKNEFAHERQERFELIKSYLAGRPFVTPQKKVEQHVVESRLRHLRTEDIEIERALKDSFEKLKLYVLLEERYPDIQVPWLTGTAALDESQWQTKVFNSNPDLAAQRLLVNRTGKERLLAQKERWSDFSVSAFYGRESVGDTERTLGAGLALPLPLLNLNTGNIKSFEKKHEAEKFLLSFQERELKTRLRQALNEYEAARKNALLYPKSLFPDLQKQIKEAEEAFRKGQLDLLLFLEIDDQTAENYYRALDVQFTLVDKLANLFFLSGEKDLYVQLGKF